jgi:hypothetical protein
VDHFRRGFAAELIKLSAKGPENPPPLANDEGGVAAKAMKPTKGLGEAITTKPATRSLPPGPLTAPSDMVGYTGAPRG